MNNKVNIYILKLTSAILILLPLLVLYPSFSLEDSEEDALKVLLESELYVKFGFFHVENGEYSEAIDAFDQAILLNPESEIARYELGVVFKYLKLTTYAIREFEILLRLDRDLAVKLHGVIYPRGIEFLRG